MASWRRTASHTAQFIYANSYIMTAVHDDFSDEFSRFLRNVDAEQQDRGSIHHHAYGRRDRRSSDGLYPNFVKAIATLSVGQYYAAANITDLVTALMNIFNSIQATNSVFSSASLPISSTTQGTYQNQVYVGCFCPDALARPRWFGNLKQYQIIYDSVSDTLALGDSAGNPALNVARRDFSGRRR